MSNLNTTVTRSSRKYYRAVVLVVVLVTVVLNNLITTLSLKLRVRLVRDSDHDARERGHGGSWWPRRHASLRLRVVVTSQMQLTGSGTDGSIVSIGLDESWQSGQIW